MNTPNDSADDFNLDGEGMAAEYDFSKAIARNGRPMHEVEAEARAAFAKKHAHA